MRIPTLPSLLTAIVANFALSGDVHAANNCPPSTCDNAPAWHVNGRYRRGDRVLGDRGNLWQCKGGSLSALCDDKGYEPDVDVNATQAWELVQSCFGLETVELSTTDIVVSAAQCNAQVTLTAVIENNSPFQATVPVAFYDSTHKTLIGVVQVVIPPWGDDSDSLTPVSIVWNNPPPNSALVTVVADDDGTGHGKVPEATETDNARSATLTTCPAP